MSADNGIYILESLDGYRIRHTQAIDNIYWWHSCCDKPDVRPDDLEDDHFYHESCRSCGLKDPETDKREDINPTMLREVFGKSALYDTEEEVLEEACNIYDEIMNDDMAIVEYGISFVRGWEDKFFPEKI